MYFHFKPMADNDVPGVVGRIDKEDHYTLLHTIVSLWELMTPKVGPFLTPGA